MTNGNRRFRRLAATGVLALGSMALLSGTPANAARDVADACPAGAAEEDGFTDTGDEGSALESAVDCLVAYGVSSGQTATTFGSTNPVNRGQMATFLMQKLDLVNGFDRPADAPNAFTDDEGNTHEANIDDAAAIDLVAGLSGDANGDGQTPDYGPAQNVTRGQMATFIVNQLEIAGVDLPDDAADAFEDDNGNTHEANINILAALDIVDGLADGTYGPNDPVSRGQMGFFLTRDLDLLAEEGLIDPLTGGQAYSVSPASAATLTFGQLRVFTADVGDADEVDIALFNCENVTTTGGVTTFADADDNGDADQGDVDAEITVVNNQSVTANDRINNVEPDEDGEVTFTVASDAFGCAVPVVYESEGDNNLALNDDNRATEDFGVGGPTTWTPGEAPQNYNDAVTVLSVDKENNTFIGDDGTDQHTFNYDANDSFEVQEHASDILGAPGNDFTANEAQFESNLSTGDEVIVSNYQPDEAGFSTFDLDDNTPDLPTVEVDPEVDSEGNTDVTVTVDPNDPEFDDMRAGDVFAVARLDIDEDANELGSPELDNALNDIQPGLSALLNAISPLANEPSDDCNVYDVIAMQDELSAENAEIVALSTKGAAQASGAINGSGNTAEFEAVDENVGQGCYLYIGTIIIDGDTGPAATDFTALPVVVGGDADITGPLLIDTRVDDGGTALNLIDNGDTITMQFNEPMAAAITGGTFRFTDFEGATFQVVCGSGATCTLGDGDANGDGDNTDTVDQDSLLTVLLTADPAHFAGVDTTAGAQTPGTITLLSSHFDDASGNQTDLENSTDKVIDVEL